MGEHALLHRSRSVRAPSPAPGSAPVAVSRAEHVRPSARIGHDVGRLPVNAPVSAPAGLVVHRCGDHPCEGGCGGSEEVVARQATDGAAPAGPVGGQRTLPPAVADVLAFGGRPLPARVHAEMAAGFAAAVPAFTPAALTVHPSTVLSAPGDPAELQAEQVATRVAAATAAAEHVGGVAGAVPDFSDVRIHTDGRAAGSAAAIHAAAYSVGRHIVFGAGRYDPESTAGRRLLAHELTHVLQQPRGTGVVQRQRCGHDGGQPKCGGFNWKLSSVDDDSDEGEWQALDDLIVTVGLKQFGGRWVTQVQTPANALKNGKDRGRVDGMRVQDSGTLRVEVVEVKSCATTHGGCELATAEATEYVRLLNGLGRHVVAISRALAANPALRAVRVSATGRGANQLKAAGVDVSLPAVLEAWRFVNSLEGRMGAPFTKAFTGFEAALFRDGMRDLPYVVTSPIGVPCKNKGSAGIKARFLTHQVNNAGGVSYKCHDGPCNTDKEAEKRNATVPQTLAGAQFPKQADATQGQGKPADEKRPGTVIPIVVGGTAVAGTGAALLAAAQKRAAQEAARKAAIALAERKAAQELARRAAARQLAERAAVATSEEAAGTELGALVARNTVGKAVAVAALVAALILVATGEAKAETGPGKSSLEALFQVMARNGAPPSPEVRELIENDPVLRAMAERAAERNDPSALQHELDRRSLAFLQEHAGEFTDEELDVMLSAAAARGRTATPPEVEELKSRIAKEQLRRRQAAGGATPHLSDGARTALQSAPAPKRKVVEAILRQRDSGPSANDAITRRLLAELPADLRPDEADRLMGAVGSAAGKSPDEIVAALRQAIASLRGKQADASAAKRDAAGKATGGAAKDTGAKDTGTTDAGSKDAGAKDTGGKGAGGKDAGDKGGESQSAYIARMLAAIAGYPEWDTLGVGGGTFRPVDGKDLTTAPLGTTLTVQLYVVQMVARNPVRMAGVGAARLIRRTATDVTIVMLRPVPMVLDDGRLGTIPFGTRPITSRLLTGDR